MNFESTTRCTISNKCLIVLQLIRYRYYRLNNYINSIDLKFKLNGKKREKGKNSEGRKCWYRFRGSTYRVLCSYVKISKRLLPRISCSRSPTENWIRYFDIPFRISKSFKFFSFHSFIKLWKLYRRRQVSIYNFKK